MALARPARLYACNHGACTISSAVGRPLGLSANSASPADTAPRGTCTPGCAACLPTPSPGRVHHHPPPPVSSRIPLSETLLSAAPASTVSCAGLQRRSSTEKWVPNLEDSEFRGWGLVSDSGTIACLELLWRCNLFPGLIEDSSLRMVEQKPV
jgi:hypothetical protein